jgi:hypothetical protein
MAAKASASKPSTLRIGNIAPDAKVKPPPLPPLAPPHLIQDDSLSRFLADICPGRRIKCTLARDAAQSADRAFLQTATLDLPDAECAEMLLLHADGAVFMGRRLTVTDPAADASTASASRATAPAADSKTLAKVRAACDLLPSASLDQLRHIMSLLDRVSQTDADHVRQVLLGSPELSLGNPKPFPHLNITLNPTPTPS